MDYLGGKSKLVWTTVHIILITDDVIIDRKEGFVLEKRISQVMLFE